MLYILYLYCRYNYKRNDHTRRDDDDDDDDDDGVVMILIRLINL